LALITLLAIGLFCLAMASLSYAVEDSTAVLSARKEFLMNNGFAIEAQNLKKSFGELQAVKGVNFRAEKGEILSSARTARQKHDHLDAVRLAAP
jgi:hypothetical protein